MVNYLTAYPHIRLTDFPITDEQYTRLEQARSHQEALAVIKDIVGLSAPSDKELEIVHYQCEMKDIPPSFMMIFGKIRQMVIHVAYYLKPKEAK